MASPNGLNVQRNSASKDSRGVATPKVWSSKSYKHLLLSKLCNWVPSNIYELLLLITTLVWLVVVLTTGQLPLGIVELWFALAIASRKDGLKSLMKIFAESQVVRFLKTKEPEPSDLSKPHK